MEFRLCPVNNPKIEASQECLDKNLLKIVGRGTSYAVKAEEKDIKLKYTRKKKAFHLIVDYFSN